MSQDSAAVPSQLDLDDIAYEWDSYADYQPSPEFGTPPEALNDSDEETESRSSTPSCLDSMRPAAHCHPQHTFLLEHTWSQYSDCPFVKSRHPTAGLGRGFQIASRFEVVGILGQGSFGTTYKALDLLQDCAEVAIKVAKVEALHSADDVHQYQYCQFLQGEAAAYHRLTAADDGACQLTGFPCMIAAGVHRLCPANSSSQPVFALSYLAMELLGPTVWDAANSMRQMQLKEAADKAVEVEGSVDPSTPRQLSQEPPRAPSSAWVIQTGKGMLKALADVHRRGYAHRDVKTENFCLRADGSNGSVFLIDFGFSRLAYGYYNFAEDYDAPCASFWGTPNYASLSALQSFPQTPRDDLEAVVYCMLEMECPNLRLPWNRDLTTNSEAKAGWSTRQLQAMSVKKHTAWQAACDQGLVPEYLSGFFNYITSLTVQDVPDYEWLLMQLDSGVTGEAPSRPPLQRLLHDWPLPGEHYDREVYTQYALSQVAAAATKILPHAPLQQPHSKRTRPASDTEEQQLQQQPRAFKRFRAVLYQDDESVPLSGEYDYQQDDKQPLSQAAADVEGSISVGALRQQDAVPGAKHLSVFGDVNKLAWTDMHGWPILADSQTDVEE